MKDFDVNNLISDIDFSKNKYTYVNKDLMLTNYQIEVLKKSGIDPSLCSSLSSLIMDAEDAYDDTLDEELDEVLNELSERNYYENTNK